MSRIGRRILEIPKEVTVTVNNNKVEVTGKLGKLEKTFTDNITVIVEDNMVKVTRKNEEKFSKQMHGTANSLIKSMMIGVSEGFKKELKIVGVGYRAALQGEKLTVSAGYSHPVILMLPKGIKLELPKPVSIIVSGIDKELVGEFSAVIRKIRKPNVYSGKGIMYVDEHIIRKEGKTAGK
jgi:large subunit ribosomal protein L6